MNETARSQFSELFRYSPTMMRVAGALTIVIMVVGVLGNLLTVVALFRHAKLRTVAAAFIASLCVSDLLFCVLVLPFAASQFFQGTWVHGDVLCVMVPVLRYGSVGVSLLCIAMISINRYVLIAYPHLYARLYTRLHVALAVAVIWAFSYCVQIPTMLGRWGTYGLDSRLGTCSINEDEHGRSPKTMLFVLAFALPCVVIVVSYAAIYWTVRRSRRRLLQHGAGCKRSEMHVTKMVLVIFVCFVVCYLPITVVKVRDGEVKHAPLQVLGYLLIYLSFCVNPVVYVTMNRQYRQAYLDTLRCTLGTTLDSQQNTPQQAPHTKTPNVSVTYLKNNAVNCEPKPVKAPV